MKYCDLSDIMALALTHIMAAADHQKRLYTDGLAIFVIRLISWRISAMMNANNWPESSLEQVLPIARSAS